MRTSFALVGGKVTATLHDNVAPTLTRVDVAGDEALATLYEQQLKAPFDLAKGALTLSLFVNFDDSLCRNCRMLCRAVSDRASLC